MGIGLALLAIATTIVIIISSTSETIDRDLLEALRGDREQAKRLLKQAKLRYPGESERWYVEKVLYDLGRDRGGSKRRERGIKFNWQNFFLVSMILSLIQFLASLFSRWFN